MFSEGTYGPGTSWTIPPNEDQLIETIVGTGGSVDERSEAAAIAREFLLPRMRPLTADLSTTRWHYETLMIEYNNRYRTAPDDALLRTALASEIRRLDMLAGRLAAARVWRALFPSEPFPENWEPESKVDVRTAPLDALKLDARMRELEDRYADRLPQLFQREELLPSEFDGWGYGEYRTIQLARMSLYIAITGDYRVTTGGLFEELLKRRVNTDHPKYDRPE